MDKRYYIPQYIDEPAKILFLTMDEVFVLALPIILGVFVINQPLVSFLLGVIAVFILKKLKGEQGHYFIFNLMYWYLPNIMNLKRTPPSYIRSYIG